MECVCVIFPICSYFIYHSLDNLLFIQNSTNYIPRGEFGSAWRDDRTYEGLVFAYVCAGVILIGVWVLVSKLFKVHRFKKKFQRYLDGILQFAFRELGNPPQFTARDAFRAAASAQAKARASGQSDAININIDNM